jgi:hypothetical protein
MVEADDDPGPFGCKQLDNSGTDAATAPCDDGGFALKGRGGRGWVHGQFLNPVRSQDATVCGSLLAGSHISGGPFSVE